MVRVGRRGWREGGTLEYPRDVADETEVGMRRQVGELVPG